MNLKKNIFLIIFTVLFLISIFFLIYSKIVYPTIWPVIKNNTLIFFHDWSYVLNSILCFEKGYDVYLNNPCEKFSNPFIYGKILLYLPFVESNLKLYSLIIPVIFNIVFIFICVSFFYLENKYIYLFLSIIFVISVPFILAVERANFDIVIAIFVFLIARFKNVYLNIFLILLASISKFYPICLSIIFLFNKKLKDFLKLFLITNFTVFLFLFFQKESLIKILKNKSLVNTAEFAGTYNFSFSGILNSINNVNGFIFFFYLLIFCLFFYFFLKKILTNNIISDLFDSNIYENRLFVLSSTILIFCYLVFSNFIYREIFFLGLLPWILKNKDNSNNSLLISLLFLLILKFVLTTLIVFIDTNNFFSSLKFQINFIKQSIDSLTILPFMIILFLSTINFFRKKL